MTEPMDSPPSNVSMPLPRHLLVRVLAIRRRVRLESVRPDGRCGKVSEAIAAELGWAYRWGHLRLLDGTACFIHCWNQLPDGTLVDATADQFEDRWLGHVVVLSPGDPRQAHYHPAPRGHLFRVEQTGGRLRLLERPADGDGQFDSEEGELATVADEPAGWTALGSRAVEAHCGWQLPEWIGREAGERLREAHATGAPLRSRDLEFALDAAIRQRRIASRGEWTSPEWRETQERGRP